MRWANDLGDETASRNSWELGATAYQILEDYGHCGEATTYSLSWFNWLTLFNSLLDFVEKGKDEYIRTLKKELAEYKEKEIIENKMNEVDDDGEFNDDLLYLI